MRSSSSNYEERQPDRLRASAGVPFGVFPAYFSLPPILYWWEGLFCPVSESVWEHLKLLYAPFLVCGFVLNRKAADTQAAWSGTLAALLAMPAFLLGVYYTLESGFSFTAGWLNITLYVLTLALGFRLSAKLCRTGQLSWLCGVLVIAAGLYGAALILFTMAPPALPIFLD